MPVHKAAEEAAGRQMRWCKTAQLIEDGLDDQDEHMRRASLLALPYLLTEPLGPDMLQTIAFIATEREDIDTFRRQALQRLRSVSSALAARSRAYASKHAGQAYKHMRL
eukprot:5066262-Amphidinium_carterae.2